MFTKAQTEAIEKGAKKRKRLVKVVHRAINTKNARPTYIYSPPGLGKTFAVNEAIANANVAHYFISGNTAMFAFGVQIATVAFMNQTSKHIILNIDDCDSLLSNEENVNIMKNMITGPKTYIYNKSMIAAKAQMNDVQLAAIDHFSTVETLGYSVPMERFRFIFTSNRQLPYDSDINYARKRAYRKAFLLVHHLAIRSRCQTNDFELEWDVRWGWIADVVLTTDVVKFLRTKKKKMILLHWMYSNWHNMTEQSIRVAEKMAEAMKANPNAYIDDWEIDFLK